VVDRELLQVECLGPVEDNELVAEVVVEGAAGEDGVIDGVLFGGAVNGDGGGFGRGCWGWGCYGREG
jgi:hypothetical protein